MCDFSIREFGHPNFSHRYSIQCVLPINLYNQQLFTFLWFWFLILFVANCWALCQWINRMLPKSRRRYINRRLNMLQYFKDLNQSTTLVMKSHGLFGKRKAVSMEAKKQKRRFIDDYLKFDGVFVLRMISMLTSEVVGTELLHELWKKRAVYKDLYFYENNQNELYLSYNETKFSLPENSSGHRSSNDSTGDTIKNSYHRPSKYPERSNSKDDSTDMLKQLSPNMLARDRASIAMKSRRDSFSRIGQLPLMAKSNMRVVSSENSVLNKENENSMAATARMPPQKPITSIISNQNQNGNEAAAGKSTKPKKVVFASSVEHGFSDIENVFSDLNVDK